MSGADASGHFPPTFTDCVHAHARMQQYNSFCALSLVNGLLAILLPCNVPCTPTCTFVMAAASEESTAQVARAEISRGLRALDSSPLCSYYGVTEKLADHLRIELRRVFPKMDPANAFVRLLTAVTRGVRCSRMDFEVRLQQRAACAL